MKKRWMMLSLIGGALLLSSCGGSGGAAQRVATHFSVTAQGNAVVGTAFKITVTALDASNNTVTTYSGTVRFSSTDAQAVLPSASSLSSGTGTFSVTLMSSGPQTITATDTVTGSITGTSASISVSSAATHFSVGIPANATAGVAFNFTVTALDNSNNTITSYSGTVHFTSTDPQASLPSNSTLTNGTGTFSATLKTPGNQTLTATDTVTASVTGMVSIAVIGPATHFSVVVPSNATTGILFGVGVVALDASNNPALGYSGTIHFTSTDSQALLPANSTLTNNSTFSATLKTVGSQTITVTDTVTASITGTSSSITVGTNAATHFSVTAPLGASPGIALSFAVSALDAANNTASTYAGTVHFTSSDPQASLPANSTLTNGGGNFSATLKTVGNQTITATDTATASITGTSNSIIIAQLAITSGQPPNGTVGMLYGGFHPGQCPTGGGSFQGFELEASGGLGSRTWSATSLPPGLRLQTIIVGGGPPICPRGTVIVIGGTPTTAGTFTNVVLTVKDSESPPATASATYTITINAAAAANAAGEARANSSASHHHYKLIDIGTFGGPQSHVNPGSGQDFGNFASILNNRGIVTGWADTPAPDPFPGFCFSGECFVVHTFEWKNGVKTDLGVLPGGASSESNWVTENGLIVGLSENGEIDPLIPGFPEFRATLWRDGKVIDLGTLPEGGFESIANAANSRGEVVGVATNTVADLNSMLGTGFQSRAFIWQDGRMEDLGTLPGGSDAQAILVNDDGLVVGWSYIGSEAAPACVFPVATGSFIWDKQKKLRDLGSLGGSCTLATDMNSRGQIVGSSNLPGDASQHAFFWDKELFEDLGGSLGGDFLGAFAVNDEAKAVGFAYLPGDVVFHATLWRSAGDMVDLGVVGADPSSYAASINSKNQIVGTSGDFVSTARLFLWEDGEIVDLNALIPPDPSFHVEFAQTINDRGEIAGSGTDANGNEHAFLLIPCDESHPGIEGCDYDPVEVVTAVEAPSQPVTHAPAEGLPKSPPVGKMTRFRSSLPNRDGRLGNSPPK